MLSKPNKVAQKAALEQLRKIWADKAAQNGERAMVVSIISLRNVLFN